MPKRSRCDDGSTDVGPPYTAFWAIAACRLWIEAGGSLEDLTLTLPEDLLSEIFSHLDVADRARATRVCSRWRDAALQPPYSTTLALRVHVADKLPKGALKPEAAAALLRGPLCGGLQRLNLDVECPSTQGERVFGAVGAALPPVLLALSLSGRLCAPDPTRALAALDLARAAPRLTELEIEPGASRTDLDLVEAELIHPSLRRLGADVAVRGGSGVDFALQLLPCLETIRSIEFRADDHPADLAVLADRGIRTGRLEVQGAPFREAYGRLLQPGAVLELVSCSLPSVAGKKWTPPVGLARLRVIDCDLTPALLEGLLSRTSLTRLDVSGGLDGVSPRDLLAALGRVPATGGTQIDIGWPDEWDEPDALAALARTLASSPALQRCVHVDRPWAIVYARVIGQALPEAVAEGFTAYRRARAAALRGMGEEGRKLMAEQGYDREEGQDAS